EIRAALTLHNARCCEPPLPEEQVAKIARSVARYDPEDTALVKVVGAGRADATQPPWPDPLPLGRAPAVPAFPAHRLPGWQRDWVAAAARATQTPPDLAGMLALGIAGAALAGKVRVEIRPGWEEPLNIYTATALLVGERKSAVFRAALDPVLEYERQEVARLTPILASRASARRVLEGRLKAAEARAAKADTPGDAHKAQAEAGRLAQELAAFAVPEPPQLFCDDITPEELGRLLARQGGRVLQAGPEGTAFEIAKGRYS